MTTTEIAVILIGGLAGYWLVTFLWASSVKPKSDAPKEESSRPENDFNQKRKSDQNGSTSTSSTQNNESTWYEVLEISRDASASEIKSAYRRIIAQYHPDKVAALGSELKDLAARKSKEINKAYEMGMAMRGHIQ